MIDFFYNQKVGSKTNLFIGLYNPYTELEIYSETKPKTNLFSFYTSLFLHDLSILNIEVGGRYNRHNEYGNNYTYNIPVQL